MGLGPINEDVRFDHDAAATLVTECNAAATVLEDQAGSRASWAATAATDFRGYFSELFASNQETARNDASELATRLREVATFAGDLADEATEEQQRRQTARDWQREQDERNLLEQGWDWLTDGNDPPVPNMPEPSNFTTADIPVRPRETPTPGSGGGSGSSGTSSARPSDLVTFADSSAGADASLEGKPTACVISYNTFVDGCGWGSLQADSVFSGFIAYLEANRTDVTWVRAIAAAFEEAGGSGSVSTLANSALTATLQASQVSASRTDIAIDPPLAFGNPPTSGYADDPVNAATGNFIENEVDLAADGGCSSLALSRTYNSFDTGCGAFGPGWSSWTEAGLDLDDEAARMRMPDGRVMVFPRLGQGWDRATGANLWLTAEDDGLVVTDNDGQRWVHRRDGRLREFSRGAGTAVRLLHDGDARLVRLEHERGRAIDLSWSDELDRVVSASIGDRVATYTYDQAGRLVSITTALGTRGYHWDDQGLIDRVTDPDGVVEAENTYDAERRVTSQRSQHGRVSRFVYLPGNVTVVSDPDGTRSNTWISDRLGRLTGAVDSEERRQSFSYDRHGNRVMVTERDGSTTVRGFDDRGRLVREVTPSGADLTFGYDDADRLTTVVDTAGGVAEYTYVGDDRSPSLLIDPEGGRTEMTWARGLLTRVVDPTGVTTSFSHDEHGDVVATTDSDGNVARLERDPEGRVVTAITPLGHRTTFRYTPSGALASRRDPDGAIWRFEHTAAGRVVTVIDPLGGRTDIEHDGAGDEVRTVDPLGRAITRQLDDLGNLSSVELPDGSRWRYTHDALSRLTDIVDPDGGTWRTEYDAVGTPTAHIDPVGVRSQASRNRAQGEFTLTRGGATRSVSLDPLGRPLSSRGVDGSASMWVHDRCGRQVEQLDPQGGLTRIERDAAGRVTRITTPAGRTTSYEYDTCGRLSVTVDPLGGRTTRTHDADGHLVEVTTPTGDTSRFEYDACGRVVSASRPGQGIARYRYDRAGRLVESSDTRHGHRRFRYDAAGQLVAAVNGNGGTTHYEYDAQGRAVRISDPLGGTTSREFNALGRCTSITDPLGRTTRARYDGAGRIVWQQDADGHVLEVGHDAAGLDETLTVDGRIVSRIARDVAGRRAVISDSTRSTPSTIELEWNPLGRLVRRSRDGQSVQWAYDADGRRTALTAPDGSTTRYSMDAAGLVIAVDHPLLGRASLRRDASGRVVEASAGGTLQRWEYAAGAVVGHTIGDDGGFTRTDLDRDEHGRLRGMARGDRRTVYEYDEACQLIEARTGNSTTRWRYDVAGRLVAESSDGTTVEHTYDAAAQLVTSSNGSRTSRFSHDGAGRRTREEVSDGSSREWTWDARGWLTGVTRHTSTGTEESTLQVDASGQLAEVDGVAVHWDTAAFAPTPVQVGDTAIVAAGAVTGVGEVWAAAGWRTRRSAGSDPWGSVAFLDEVSGGPTVRPDGGLMIAGLEWMQARVYDPASRGFLSTDPVTPTTGAGWAHNPYSYAGNDPLHTLDPLGLTPLTDAELSAYNASHNGFTTWADTMVERIATPEFLISAGLTALGAAAFFLPIPGAQIIGGVLVSAGVSGMSQQLTTGSVDWGEVAISGAFGAVGGFGAGAAIRMGVTGTVRTAAVGGAITGGAEGFVTGNYQYLTGPGPHTPQGYVQTVGSNMLTSAATGGVMGPVEMRIDQAGFSHLMQSHPHTPLDYPTANPNLGPSPTPVIGNSTDVGVATSLDPSGHVDAMSPQALQQAIDYQNPVYLGSNVPDAHSGQVQTLLDAGYTLTDDFYLVPGGG